MEQDGIHYRRTGGDKPAMVLLHGVQVDGTFWSRTAEAFHADYDVIMPDFRGHGESARMGDISGQTLVQDTTGLLQSLNVENPIVIGHSMGAEIAARLATVYRVKSLVLVDPALMDFMASMPPMDVDNPPPWMQSIFDTIHALKTLSQAERLETGKSLLPPGAPEWNAEDFKHFVNGQANFDINFYKHMVDIGYVFEQPDILAQIPCPVLLLTARPMMGDISAGLAAFLDHVPNIQHIHFDDSGHAIPFEQFDRFIQVVCSFITS